MNDPNGFSNQQLPSLEQALQDHIGPNRAEIEQSDLSIGNACYPKCFARVMTQWQHGLSPLCRNEAFALGAAVIGVATGLNFNHDGYAQFQ